MKTLSDSRCCDELLLRAQKLTPQTLRRWGKMSAHEMICHLNDAFRLYMGLITVSHPGFPYPSRLLKWASLWVPVTWPRGFKTVAEIDQQKGGNRPTDFVRDIAELKDLLAHFAHLTPTFVWPAHPYLGRMSYKEWMRLGYLHTDHHLRQFGV